MVAEVVVKRLHFDVLLDMWEGLVVFEFWLWKSGSVIFVAEKRKPNL